MCVLKRLEGQSLKINLIELNVWHNIWIVESAKHPYVFDTPESVVIETNFHCRCNCRSCCGLVTNEVGEQEMALLKHKKMFYFNRI